MYFLIVLSFRLKRSQSAAQSTTCGQFLISANANCSPTGNSTNIKDKHFAAFSLKKKEKNNSCGFILIILYMRSNERAIQFNHLLIMDLVVFGK